MWKGLKFGGHKASSEKVQEADSTVPLSDHVPRAVQSSEQAVPRASESLLVVPEKIQSTSFDIGERKGIPLSERVLRAQQMKRNRFSMLRFRHASDPQLSATYKEGECCPPIPPIPATTQPPTIITTSPTTDDFSEPARRKSIFSLSHNKSSSLEKSKSAGASPTAETANPLSQATTSPTAPSTAKGSHVSFDESQGRDSSTSLRSGPARWQDTSNQGLLPAARVSESSRSEASSGENGVYINASKTDASSSTSSFFRMPKMKKPRHSLFPFQKLTPSGQNIRHGKNVRAAPSHSMDQDREMLSPLPSPRSLGHAARTHGSPDSVLLRKNSTASTHSVRSSMSTKLSSRPSRKGRPSTAVSLADIQDNAPTLSPVNSSNQLSFYTSPRKSFSDLFHPSYRSKLNVNASVGDGSPVKDPGTPQSMSSKQNSFCLAREIAACPPKEPDDTPATYLTRLENAIHRATIATVLSHHADDFHKTALRKYMRGFAFFGDAMDMAIRKLLMEVELPKETQQIDRVLQSFADRYHECNPGVFASTDQAYFITFSLLILHTDVFNKNNKRKMQKQDYVRNAGGEGVAADILECFYDNICYTPFIHVEDEINLGVRRLTPKSRSPLFKSSSSDQVSKSMKEPVDPYALILDGNLGILRPNLKDEMHLEDVYSASGSGDGPGINELHKMFYRPCILQIVSERSRPDAFLTQSSIANPAEAQPGLVDIRVAKVGLLWRKDPKKKKTRSPWQEWGAVLTGSQLYFFKDVQWVKTLISQYEANQISGRRQPVTFQPPVTNFKPDAIMSTADAVALLDSSYKKHKHAFLFVRHGGLEEVFLANSEAEMNSWIATINYAATFRTTGVRMRGVIGVDYEGRQSRKRNRASSIKSETSALTVSEDVGLNMRRMDPQLAEEIFAARRELVSTRISEAEERLSATQSELDTLLQNARHLQILTPISFRTRDQVILAAGKMAAKIKWARLEFWRTKCHRDVLALDLAEEETHVSVKKVAKSRSPSKHENRPVSEPLGSEPNPSLAPTSPRSNKSLRKSRSRSPTPTRDTYMPGDLIENVLSGGQRPELTKSASATLSEISAPTPKPLLGVSKDDSSLPRQVSLTSSLSRLESSTGKQSSGRRTPTPSMIDTEDERLLREAGILSNELLQQMSTEGTDEQHNTNDKPIEPSSNEGRAKVRRSLHRTLRDNHLISHHQRSKKGKEAAARTSAATDDGSTATETEILARSTGSFTLHGKKASVVTFGSEWDNMSPEQRLKERKPNAEETRASEMGSDSQGELTSPENFNGKKTYSLRSISTARSMKQRDGGLEKAGGLASPGESLTETSSFIIDENEALHQIDKPRQAETVQEQTIEA